MQHKKKKTVTKWLIQNCYKLTLGYGKPLLVLKAGNSRRPRSLAICSSSSWYHCMCWPPSLSITAMECPPNRPLSIHTKKKQQTLLLAYRGLQLFRLLLVWKQLWKYCMYSHHVLTNTNWSNLTQEHECWFQTPTQQYHCPASRLTGLFSLQPRTLLSYSKAANET